LKELSMSLRFGTARISVMRKDLKKIREKLEAKLIKLEGIPAQKKLFEELQEIELDLAKVDAKMLKLLKMKGVK